MQKIFFLETAQFYRVKYEDSKHLDPINYYPRIRSLAFFEESLSTESILWLNEAQQKLELKLLFSSKLVQPYTDTFLNHKEGFIWALNNKNIQFLNIVVSVYNAFEGLTKIKEKYYSFLADQCRQLIARLQEHNSAAAIVTLISEFVEDHNHILIKGLKKN